MSYSTKLNKAFYTNISRWLLPLQKKKLSKINFLLIEAYWNIGQFLEAHTSQKDRVKETKTINKLVAQSLNKHFQKNYTPALVQQWRNFYHTFPTWKQVSPTLTWSHYKLLMNVENTKARMFYTRAASNQEWTIQQLKRQIEAAFYERSTPSYERPTPRQSLPPVSPPEQLLKELYILEFLNLAQQNHFLEKEMEDALLEKLQFFLMELGEGFAFVARQKRIVTATGKQFFIDLVFYHFILKCFVLIDLKITELSHRDIGQMDMYVRLMDEKWRSPSDQPTIGILLCPEKDETIVQYSILSHSPQLFAAKYLLQKPNSDELEDKVKAALQRIEWQK